MKKYEIRLIDAWADGDIWNWNDSFILDTFVTNVKNEKQLFLNTLHKLGYKCKKGKCYVYDDGSDTIELRERKTQKPLLAMIIEEDF